MAVPANTLKLSIRGTLPGGEIWNSGIWLRSAGDDSAPTNGTDCATLLNTITTGTGWTSLRTAILGLMRATGALVEERLYSYPVAGNVAAAVAAKADAAAGTSTSGTLPNQVCCVMTLLTGVSGRSQRGRIYWPATGLALDPTNGQFSTTQSALRSGFAAWVLERGSAGSDNWVPFVVSTTHTSSLSVQQVRVDTRPDIQRRRANKQVVASSAVTNTPWI